MNRFGRVFNQQGRGGARALRIFSDFSLQSLADSHQPLARRSLEAFAVCRSRHPAAKRLVQKAFSIGVTMRKALSVVCYMGSANVREVNASPSAVLRKRISRIFYFSKPCACRCGVKAWQRRPAGLDDIVEDAVRCYSVTSA